VLPVRRVAAETGSVVGHVHPVEIVRDREIDGHAITPMPARPTFQRAVHPAKLPLRQIQSHRTAPHARPATRLDGSSSGKWCPGAESNHRHADFQSAALPTELPGHPGKAALKGSLSV